MGLNLALSVLGLAKQASKGAVVAQPAYVMPLLGGNAADFEPEQKLDELTSGTIESISGYRSGIGFGAAGKARAYAKILGLMLLGAMGSDTVTGTGSFTHTYSFGIPPWLTAWGQAGAANYVCLSDAMLDELTLSWEGTDPLEVEAVLLSCGLALPTTITPVADETFSPYFVPIGGSFQLDAGGAVPVDAPLAGGEFKIGRGCEAFYASGSVLPSDIDPKALNLDVKLKVRAATDLAVWKTTLTGTPAGTTPSQTIVWGSYLVKFMCGADELTVKSQKCAFTCKFPEGDPKGGAPVLELTGLPVKKDAATPSLEVILKNTVASY